jgi:hypothetical protein
MAKVVAKIGDYELAKVFRWGGMLTHIVLKNGKEIGQYAPNLKSEFALKYFKQEAPKGKFRFESIKEDSPCWDGYKQIGMKMKNGKEVPNCVKESINEENEPNNPALWDRAVAAAKAKYDVYPSAYANAFASKWYKEKGGTWKTKSESVNEADINVDLYRGKQSWVIGPKFAEVASDSDIQLMVRLKRVNDDHAWQLKQNIKSMDYLYKKYKIRSKKGIEESINESHTGDPNDKYVVRPCKNPNEPWAVWEGEVRVKGFATKEEAQAFADMKNKQQGISEANDSIDTISMDVPLFIRLLEYSREDAKSDMDLHNVSQNVIKMSKENDVLTMANYEGIVSDSSLTEANVGDFEIGDFVHFKSKNKTGMVMKISGNKVTINTLNGPFTGDIKDIQVLYQDNVNEGISSNDMEKIKSAVEAASSFMSVGTELKKTGMRYIFATSPMPIYVVQDKSGNRVAIVNKKYATKPDFLVGDIAVGIMESMMNKKQMVEGNAFTGALFKARQEGLTEFEFNGKMYPVKKLDEETEEEKLDENKKLNVLKTIIKEEYHAIKSFMEQNGIEIGKLYSNPQAKSFVKEEEEEVVDEYDVENYEEIEDFKEYLESYMTSERAGLRELKFKSAGVKELLTTIFNNKEVLPKLGFKSFKEVLSYIKFGDQEEQQSLQAKLKSFGIQVPVFESKIEEMNLASAGVKEVLKQLYSDKNLVKYLGFKDFKGAVYFIKNGMWSDFEEVRDDIKKYKKQLGEAEYQGRKVKLGKIMQGDVKKFKVYVKNDKGNVVKVNFGQGGDAKGGTMRIRKDNPEARASFRARHNCDSPGPRWKARYWSCKKW